MSEDSVYNDADIVWVKLGNSWWPGEVCGQQRQPEGFLQLAKRKPYCVVKFFQEDTFEYVKSSKHILPFNCSKKDEFIKKGHELFKAKKKFMEKFPSDVSTAERLTRSVTRSTLFFNSRPDSIVKAILGQSPAKSDIMRNGGRCGSVTKIMNLTPNRNTETRSLPTSPATYKCSLCDFQSTRQNVMVLHRKSHSNTPATTRSSLVNSSTNTSPTEVDSQNRSVSQTISVGTSPPLAKPIGRKTPVPRKSTSVQSNDTAITVEDESDCSSEENVLEKSISTDISVVNRSNDLLETKNHTIVTVQDSPVHKKEENVNVLANKSDLCKSVEIQKSLLADWIDEDKDEEEEDQTPSEIKSKPSKEAIPALNDKEGNSALTISAPTSPELLKGVDLTYLGETSSSSESSKPSTRIRNIPKKDRRNINFADFKEDDLPNKTTKEPESSLNKQLPLIDLVDDSSNETVSKQHDAPLPVDTNTNEIRLCEENLLVKSLPAQSKATTDGNLIEQNKSMREGTAESTFIPQDGTSDNDQSHSEQPKETVSRRSTLSSPQLTVCKDGPTIATEYNTEPCVRIESNADPLQKVSSVNTETSLTEEPPEDLNNVVCIPSESTAPNEEKAFKYSPRNLVTSSPTKFTPEQIETLVEGEPTPIHSHSELSKQSHETSVNNDITENLCPVELSSEENVEMQVSVSVSEQSEVESSANEILPLGPEITTISKNSEVISVNKDNSTEDMSPVKLPLEKNIDMSGYGEKQSEVNPLTKKLSPFHREQINALNFKASEETENLVALESRCSPVCVYEEPIAEEHNPLFSNNDDGSVADLTATRTSPLIGIQRDVSVDAGEGVLPKNDESAGDNLSPASILAPSLEQSIHEKPDGQPSQGEECVIQSNVETIIENPVSEEQRDNEENKVGEATVAITLLENEVINHVEVAESKVSKSVNRTSLSCFDFEEEEDNDILTSIAKFKKKNIASERNSDISKDSRAMTPDAQKQERELKDKQLSAEIESLLKTTEMLVPTNSSASAEVRGLPIKERGKRIFKSRNRFKSESCSSVSTTSSAIKKTESPTLSKKEDEIKALPIKPIEAEQQSLEKVNRESEKVPDQVHVQESVVVVDKMSFDNDNAIDDKVTNSEEEIVGRVVFSPAEVYAPSPENTMVDYSETTDAQVSSSGVEIVSEVLPVSDGNAKDMSAEESSNRFPIEDNLKNLPNNNSYENLEAIEGVRYQSENEPYYEVVEGQLEAIVQFVGPEEGVENQIIEEEMEDIQQEVHDQLNDFFVVEESEPIYEEEVSYEDVSNKAIDPSYENSNDYELITTEVSSIVERIASEENSVECDNEMTGNVAKVSYVLERETEMGETAPVCVELNKRLSTDCNLALFSTTDNAEVDSQCTLVERDSGFSREAPSTQSDNVILSEESNTCSTVDNVSKSSYNDKNINNEDKLVQSQVERTEISSDENSTIISEAEAEFGSPTSMLEEDRVLKRARRGSETSTTNIECPKSLHKSRVQKNEAMGNRRRLSRKDNALLQQSMQSDTNESGSNDVQSSSSNINDSEKEGGKENVDNMILKVIQKELLKMKEKEGTKRGEVLSINEEHLSESNTETDSGDEGEEDDEEEISSPPIEPLQDENVVETYPDISLSASNSIEFSNKEKEKTAITEECSSDAANMERVHLNEKNDALHNSASDGGQPNQSSSSLYTLSHSTETVIKLSKNNDILTDIIDTGSSHVIEQKSDIAGEELSAAEALLSIPNQSSSNLGDSHDLSTLPAVSTKSPLGRNENSSTTEIEVKDEPMDSSDLSLKLSERTPKDFIRRKGRSHLKVTPRKRIIEAGNSDKPQGQELSAKIPKLSNDSLPSCSKSALNNDGPEHQTNMFETKENLVETVATNQSDLEKLTPEKVHITVDISNPLSSQIANILGSIESSDGAAKNVAQKRKQTLEDDITSFVIKKPSPTTDAEAEAADRETIAQIQNLCPQVEITRKSSKDEQTSLTANLSQTSMPLILNNQILRTGNNQPIITVTPKSKKPEEAFDISNMPIVLSNENVINEKVHLVITPTSNPQIIKQFQNQQQLVLNQRPDSRSFTPSPINTTVPRITNRRQSNLRTKRTPTRQQIQEQNTQKEQETQQKSNQEESLQPHILQQHYNPQTQVNTHQQQQQQQPTQLQQHKRQQQFRPNQQVQMHSQHSPAQFQNQFQLHQQQKLQQQLHEEQNILIQQHQQQMIIQQQIQMQQNQQRPQQQRQQQQQQQHQQQQQQIMMHQQLLPVEKNNHLNTSDKQMGVDARGKKYVIIKAPSNTVVMDNNPETVKGGLQNLQQSRSQQMIQQKNPIAQRKQRQITSGHKKQLPHQLVQPPTMQTIPNIKALNQTSTVTQLPPSSLPHMAPVSHHLPVHNSPNVSYTNEAQRYFKEQQPTQHFTPTLPSLPVIPAKGRGSGRGRRAKQIGTPVPTLPTLENTPKNAKSSANGRRTTGTYCEQPRHRTTRSAAAKKNNNSVLSPNERQPSPTTSYQSTVQPAQKIIHMSSSQCTVNTVNSVTTISTAMANSLPMKGQPLSAKQGVIADIPIEKSRGSGGCYAVPALPVPGFPHTFLVCELIDNKYREAYAKLLYLSPDGTRLCEIPDELVTEAHLKLRDDQREPNPDYIQVGSGALQIDKSIRVQMSEEHELQGDGKMENNGKSNEVFMQKHNSLTVEEQASALLCLQEQIVQEQLAQEQLVQKQYVQEHLVHEQLVQEQLAQEQLVQEQLVQEQFVQEHFVQDQFGREQFVQEQFVQEQFVPEQFVQEQIAQEQLVREQFMQHHQLKGDQDILHVAHSIENDEAHDSIIQQLDADTVVMDESVESPNAVVLNIGSQHLVLDHTAFMNMCENNTEGMSPGGNIFTLTQEGLQELLNSYNSTRNESSAMVFTGDGCEQRVMMNENILHTDDTSPDGLRIALNDPRLYAEEQFINSGSILQIETPEGLRLISTAPGSSGIVIQSMPSDAKTCESNILDQGHKSSPAHDEKHSDNIKSKFETDPSATTLDDCLNVIGVSAQSPPVPTSLELSHSEIVTKNRGQSPGTIAMNEIVATGLCHHPDITSLPSMGSNEQDIHYGFFSSNTGSHNDKVNANGESVVTDMDEYTVGSSGGNFDDPGR